MKYFLSLLFIVVLTLPGSSFAKKCAPTISESYEVEGESSTKLTLPSNQAAEFKISACELEAIGDCANKAATTLKRSCLEYCTRDAVSNGYAVCFSSSSLSLDSEGCTNLENITEPLNPLQLKVTCPAEGTYIGTCNCTKDPPIPVVIE